MNSQGEECDDPTEYQMAPYWAVNIGSITIVKPIHNGKALKAYLEEQGYYEDEDY